MQRLHSAIPYAGRRLPFLARHALAHSHPLSTAAAGGGGSSSSADIGNAASLPDTLARLSLSTEVVPPGVPEATVASRVHFLEALGVPDIPAAVRADPQLLSRDLLTEARPRLEYLLSLGVDGIGPMVGKCPQLLTCDVTHDLLRRVNILRALGVVNISRWLQANPYIMMMDVETDIRPAVEFLRTVESVDVGKVLERAPLGIFGRVDHLRERVRFFEETLGLSPRSRVGRMISRYPPVLGFSTTAIEAKVEWFKSIGISDVAELLHKHPRVLALAVETLAAKHHFLTDPEQWGLSTNDIEHFPQALTYSLTYLRSRGGFLKASPEGKGGKLHRVLRTADYLFANKLCRRSVEEYQAFARAVAILDGGAAPGDVPRTLSELAEEANSMVDSMHRPEVAAGDKAWAQSLKRVEVDEALQSRLDAAKVMVEEALRGGRGARGDGAAPSQPDVATPEGATTAEAEMVDEQPVAAAEEDGASAKPGDGA